MKYTRYGLTFHLLREADLEMVRQWRNDPVVANNYEFREYITPEMQQTWFRSVSNINNLYTVIEYEGKKIGVINVKDIDWEARTCEGGIFLPDPAYHQTFIPAIISFITTEIIFVMFEWKTGYARVLKTNKGVQSFVKMLGYELMPGQEEIENQRYQATLASFENLAPKIRKAVSALAGNEEPGIFIVEASEYDDPLVLAWEERVKTSSHILRVEERPDGRYYWFG